MSKKNPIPALATPVEKAIRDLIAETRRNGSAVIDGVIIHPSDLPTLGALITQKPLPSGGPLMKAYEEMKKNQANNPLYPGSGQPVTYKSMVLAPHQVQAAVSAMSLEQQLEESLWALVEIVMPAAPVEVAEHSPHMQGSTERIRKVTDDAVFILCGPCKTALKFNRCVYDDGYGNRCEEEVPVVEAGTALCVFHRPQAWKDGSRFYKCQYVVLTAERTYGCTNVATTQQEDGRYVCNDPEHRT